MVDVFGGSGLFTGQRGPRGLPGPRGQDGATEDPTSSYETYVKYINLRRKTIHSILGLVKITSNLSVYHGYLQAVLESHLTVKDFTGTIKRSKINISN